MDSSSNKYSWPPSTIAISSVCQGCAIMTHTIYQHSYVTVFFLHFVVIKRLSPYIQCYIKQRIEYELVANSVTALP